LKEENKVAFRPRLYKSAATPAAWKEQCMAGGQITRWCGHSVI